MKIVVTAHFIERFRERVSKDGDPDLFARTVVECIETRNTDYVAFYDRLNRNGRRVFKVMLPDGGRVYVVINMSHARWAFMTVLLPGHSYSKYSKSCGRRVLP